MRNGRSTSLPLLWIHCRGRTRVSERTHETNRMSRVSCSCSGLEVFIQTFSNDSLKKRKTAWILFDDFCFLETRLRGEPLSPGQVLRPRLCLSSSLLFICSTRREVPSPLVLGENKEQTHKDGLPLHPPQTKPRYTCQGWCGVEWQVFHEREKLEANISPICFLFLLRSGVSAQAWNH